MTAEIAVLNQQAVALAADSAVTVSGTSTKIFSSAHKIFALSKYQPVGIMIHGHAELLNVPWETAIKRFRGALGRTRFDTLPEYLAAFLEYLRGNQELYSPRQQERYFQSVVWGYYQAIYDHIIEDARTEIDRRGKVSDAAAKKLIREAISAHLEIWDGAERLDSLPEGFESAAAETLLELIEEAFEYYFSSAELSAALEKRLKGLPILLVSRVPPAVVAPQTTTGIVVAGFGASEIYPSLVAVQIDGVVLNEPIFWGTLHQQISDEQESLVVPFAQIETVATFMEGVDPKYQRAIEESAAELLAGYTEELFDSAGVRRPTKARQEKLRSARTRMLAAYFDRLRHYRQKQHWGEIVEVVSALPKDELAEMADALVSLESLKRKVSLGIETVGGPVDVAVISPADGFIWIRRKHYFSPDLNPQFFANYYRDEDEPREKEQEQTATEQRAEDESA